MPDNRTKDAPPAGSSAPGAGAAAPGPDKFAVADLIARSTDFLGQPTFITAGALHGVTDPLTIDDAKARVTDWLQKPAEEA